MRARPRPPRPTLRDIARRAHCHYSTVSLALRNHPRIGAETRVRVQQVAAALNYRPDPMLAALNAYRIMKSPPPPHGVLAWLNRPPPLDRCRPRPPDCMYYRSAQSRAEERGYRLERFQLGEQGFTARRLCDILQAREINGLLLAPRQQPLLLRLEWSDFAAVSIGAPRLSPPLHNVFHDDYRIMTTLLAELRLRGYQRPGLVELGEDVDQISLAAYLVDQRTDGDQPHLPPLMLEQWHEATFIRWLKQYQPDVLVSTLPEAATALRRAGYRVPHDIGFALPSMIKPMTPPECSGMRKHPDLVAQLAVDLLVDLLHRHQRGLPALPQQIIVGGSWHEGSSLCARADWIPPHSCSTALHRR